MGLLNLFGQPRRAPAATVQTARSSSHPFCALDGYTPLAGREAALYRAIREAIPLVDAAIGKIVRLTGGFHVLCDDAAAQKPMEDFFATVPVGGCSQGIDAFISAYLDQMLLYGTAVGEMILSPSRREIAALFNADLDELEIQTGNNPLHPRICRIEPGGARPVPYPSLVLLSALNPEPGQAVGRSLLKGLPFVTGILLKIFNTIGLNFERVGNVRFAVTYRPGNDAVDRAFAKDRAILIADEWAKAMQSSSAGQVSDFVSVGDVDIKVIGADNQILDASVPARLMLEQIVAKTGIPPFLLGLSWSSTERMSAQQVDILTSELESYRQILTPVIRRIGNLWLRLHGYADGLSVEWNIINLQDEVELAKAALIKAQAAAIEKKESHEA